MARTAFIAFAGFFVGSVVTASLAYVAQDDLPPVGANQPPLPLAKPAAPAMLATAPSPTTHETVAGEEAAAGRRIATAGFVPSGPIFGFRTPSRATAPVPPVPRRNPRAARYATQPAADHHAHGDDQDAPAPQVAARVDDEQRAPARHEPATTVRPVPSVAPAVPVGDGIRDGAAGDDRPAWQRYAALSPPTEGRPMIAIVLDDVGLSQFRADRAIALPGPLTISILPYGDNVQAVAQQARRAGHEVMLHLPMEPRGHDHDPGPNALLTGLEAGELQRRIELNLARFDGYVGINNHMGSRFTASEAAVTPVMQVLRERGLLFLDSVTSTKSVAFRVASQMGIPSTARDVFIDDDIEPRAIRRQLRLIEQVANKRGAAIAIGHPHPETLQALREWLPRLSARGYVLVPISAITAMRLAG